MDAPVCSRQESLDLETGVSQVEAHPIHDADDANGDVGEEDGFEGLPIVTNDRELLQRGICRVRIPKELDADRWAEELSQVTPMILGFEGDGEYAFYRNILDEPEFPFETILFGSCSRNSDDNKVEVITRAEEPEPITNGGVSEIGRSILEYFPILPGNPEPATVKIDADATADRYSEILSRELRLDDAFCVHYNMDQDDTSGAKHMDPSDITINICLHKSKDARGSFVLFHGTKHLEQMHPNDDDDESTDIKALIPIPAVPTILPAGKEDRFLVPQREGYATIHFGDHPHETTPLRRGSRTNIILTYLYTDPTRSDAATRSCY